MTQPGAKVSEAGAVRSPEEEASTGVRKASGTRLAVPGRSRVLVVASGALGVEPLLRALAQPPFDTLLEVDVALSVRSALDALAPNAPQPDAILIAHEVDGRSTVAWCDQLASERPGSAVFLLIPPTAHPYAIDPAIDERHFFHSPWPCNPLEVERLGSRLASEVRRARARRSGEHRVDVGVDVGRARDHRLETVPATILVIDPYDAARAEAAAVLRADARFKVQELADPSAALARAADQRHEAYLVMLDRDPAPAYALIHGLRLDDADAVIIATDDRQCADRGRMAKMAGAATHVFLPLHNKDLHLIDTCVYEARHRPTQFGTGKQVRVRLDVGKLIVEGVATDLGKNTERKVIEALCLAYGDRVSEDALLKAGEYAEGASSARVALRKLLLRFRDKLGAYGFCLIQEGSMWRLEIPGTWLDVP